MPKHKSEDYKSNYVQYQRAGRYPRKPGEPEPCCTIILTKYKIETFNFREIYRLLFNVKTSFSAPLLPKQHGRREVSTGKEANSPPPAGHHQRCSPGWGQVASLPVL